MIDITIRAVTTIRIKNHIPSFSIILEKASASSFYDFKKSFSLVSGLVLTSVSAV
jgi:hypothetical protein